ncbi:TRAP transporter small permease [Paracoccus aerius]
MLGSIAALSRLNSLLSRISLWLAGSGLVAMTIIVFAQVFMRYVMNDSLLWVEPVAILLMSWFIFLDPQWGFMKASTWASTCCCSSCPKAREPG